jgi:hypothetical protein
LAPLTSQAEAAELPIGCAVSPLPSSAITGDFSNAQDGYAGSRKRTFHRAGMDELIYSGNGIETTTEQGRQHSLRSAYLAITSGERRRLWRFSVGCQCETGYISPQCDTSCEGKNRIRRQRRILHASISSLGESFGADWMVSLAALARSSGLRVKFHGSDGSRLGLWCAPKMEYFDLHANRRLCKWRPVRR